MDISKNFNAKYKYKLTKSDKVVRVLELENTAGEKAMVELSAKEMTDFRCFREKIASCGEYYFLDSSKSFTKFIEDLTQQEYQNVEVIEKLGRMHPGYFVTSNVLYVAGNGVEISPDGFFKFGETYKLDKKLENTKVELLATVDNEKYKTTLNKFIKTQQQSLNGNLDGLFALAWLRASLHATELIKSFGFFPFLLVVGEKGSGKNFFCKTLLRIVGMDSDGDGIPSSTQVGILRKSTTLVDLPYWLDEYSDNKESGKKIEGLLRSAFNRSAFVKADLDSNIAVSTTVCTSTFILSGESMSSDSATKDRFINIVLDRSKQNITAKNDLQKLEKDLNIIGSKWVMERSAQGTKKLIEKISEELDILTKVNKGKDTRLLTSYAYISVFLQEILNEANIGLNLDDLISNTLSVESEMKEGSSHVIKFWEDFITLARDEKLENGKHYYLNTNWKLSLHWQSVKQQILISRAKERLEQRIEEDTLKLYLQQAHGYKYETVRPMLADGRTYKSFKAYIFDLKTLPEFVQEHFNYEPELI